MPNTEGFGPGKAAQLSEKPIMSAWVRYWERIKPEGASRIQEIETRRAFFAGVYSLMQIQIERLSRTGDSDEPTPEDLALMDTIEDEVRQFFVRIGHDPSI